MKKIFVFLLLISFVTVPQTKKEMRAIWLTNVDSNVLMTDKNIADAMDYLASIGINVVFPVVYNKGFTLYPSQIMDSLFQVPIWQPVTGRDPLQKVIIEAHRNGIEVIPWYEFGFSSSYSQNGGHIVSRFPHWAGKDRNGNLLVKNGFDWLAGTNPEVQDFMISLITEMLDNYDVDGVQGDDRLPAMPVEGGYDSVTVELYRAEHSGNNPPFDFRQSAWMRWRANNLNDFLARLRDTVKTRSEHLIISTSPSVFPWGYNEYLQDSKTWVENGLTDNFIPQLYRQTLQSYNLELNQALGYVPQNKRDIFFAGILAKSGSYVITPELLLDKVASNRSKNVMGETFFFYEGLRANNSANGNALGNAPYSEPALVPFRNGNIRRPKAEIVNEDDEGAVLTGNWQLFPIPGFKPNVYMTNSPNYASIEYYFDVPFDAWFDVYVYIYANTVNADNAPYTVYSSNDSTTLIVSQRDSKNAGWYKLTSVYLEKKNNHRLIKLHNTGVEAGKYIVADAAMIMINRKLSPDVVVTGVKENEIEKINPESFYLEQNYPNPFNPTTKIKFSIPKTDSPLPGGARGGLTTLKVYDILGREITTLVNEAKQPGIYEVEFNAEGLSSGVYYYQLITDGFVETKKMILLR